MTFPTPPPPHTHTITTTHLLAGLRTTCKSLSQDGEGGCAVFLLSAGFMGRMQAEICDFTLPGGLCQQKTGQSNGLGWGGNTAVRWPWSTHA